MAVYLVCVPVDTLFIIMITIIIAIVIIFSLQSQSRRQENWS